MKFDQQKYQKEWYTKNRERILARGKEYYKKNKDLIKKKSRDYCKQNPERYSASRKRIRRRIMTEIFDRLGNKCELCGIEDKIILQIDHINGGGSKHLRRTACSIKGYYKDILESVRKQENKYRLLCGNCNISEAVRKGFRKSTWID